MSINDGCGSILKVVGDFFVFFMMMKISNTHKRELCNEFPYTITQIQTFYVAFIPSLLISYYFKTNPRLLVVSEGAFKKKST